MKSNTQNSIWKIKHQKQKLKQKTHTATRSGVKAPVAALYSNLQ